MGITQPHVHQIHVSEGSVAWLPAPKANITFQEGAADRQQGGAVHSAFFYQITNDARGASRGQLPVGRESLSEPRSYWHIVGVPLDPNLLVRHVLENVAHLLEHLEARRLHLALT